MIAPAAIVFALAAQAAPAAALPAPLVVSSSYWGRVELVDVATGRTLSQEPLDPNDPDRKLRGFSRTASRLTRRETYALVRNAGSRKVKAVRWDYVFYDTAKHEHEVKRFHFRTKATLAPGETKFLSEQVTEPAPSAFGAVEVVGVDTE